MRVGLEGCGLTACRHAYNAAALVMSPGMNYLLVIALHCLLDADDWVGCRFVKTHPVSNKFEEDNYAQLRKVIIISNVLV